MSDQAGDHQKILRQLTEAAEERERILADPSRAEPAPHPEKFTAFAIGLDDEGRPLRGHLHGRPPEDEAKP